MKRICISICFMIYALTGPGVHSDFSVDGDTDFDLKDVAKLQNNAREVNGQVKFEVQLGE